MNTKKSIDALKAERTELLAEKNRLTLKLAHLNDRLASTLPMEDFQKLESTRRTTVTDLMRVESRIIENKPKIAALCEAEHAQRVQADAVMATNDAHKDVMGLFIEMRDNYQTFAADATRSPTMRRMASEFVSKMTPIIRKALNQRA